MREEEGVSFDECALWIRHIRVDAVGNALHHVCAGGIDHSLLAEEPHCYGCAMSMPQGHVDV